MSMNLHIRAARIPGLRRRWPPARLHERAPLLLVVAYVLSPSGHVPAARLWRTFIRHVAAMSLLLLSATIIARIFGADRPLRWPLAVLTMALISVLRTLLDTWSSRHAGGMLESAGPRPDHRPPAAPTMPVAIAPHLATRKAFDDAVRRALTHLGDPTRLATSPLLDLALVTRALHDQGLEDTRLTRVAVLKPLLVTLIGTLRPPQHEGDGTDAAWRYYNCLYYPYVRGFARRRVPTALRALAERRSRDGSPRGDLERALEWLMQVDEDTYYKWQRRGSDTIAGALRERERAAGGTVPETGYEPLAAAAAS